MADYVNSREWGRIFAHAWKHPDFKEKLEKDPKSAIAEVAGELGINADSLYKVPERPADLTDEQIERIRSGKDQAHFTPAYCC